jgi:hypothetical protein
MQSRRWCFTLNNPVDTELSELHDFAQTCTYFIAGYEVGASGTAHIQGYFVCPKAWRLSRLRKLNGRAHFETAKGTSEQNRAYCSKEGNFEEFGTCPLDGEGLSRKGKADWKKCIESARRGDFESIPSDLYVRYRNTWHNECRDYGPKPPARDVLDNEWWWGPTGTGKSRTAYETYPDAYRKGLNKWWDHYRSETVVIIEEWSPKLEMFLTDFLKNWSDHYPFIAEKKGTSQFIRPLKIIITSNYSMQECFTQEQDRLPLLRRFKVTHFGDHVFNPALRPVLVTGDHYP